MWPAVELGQCDTIHQRVANVTAAEGADYIGLCASGPFIIQKLFMFKSFHSFI